MSEQGELRIRADLVVACDGRSSTLRNDARLPTRDFGAPRDVLWFRMPRETDDPPHSMGVVDRGRMLVLINRSDYRSEEHTSELKSLMRISYAVFCLKQKKH